MVEQRIRNAKVTSSIPVSGTNLSLKSSKQVQKPAPAADLLPASSVRLLHRVGFCRIGRGSLPTLEVRSV